VSESGVGARVGDAKFGKVEVGLDNFGKVRVEAESDILPPTPQP